MRVDRTARVRETVETFNIENTFLTGHTANWLDIGSIYASMCPLDSHPRCNGGWREA
jgi:hypothetical protein